MAIVAGGVGAGLWLTQGNEGVPRVRPEWTFTLPSMAPGKAEFTLASLEIHALGKEVQIVSVTPLTSPNIEYLGAFAAWPRDHDDGSVFAGGRGFPSEAQPKRHPLHQPIPASETGLVPEGFEGPQPVTVNAGFRLLSGVGAVNGVTVVYKLDGRTKRKHFRQAVIGCLKPHKCNRGLKDDNFTSDVLERYGLVKD